MRTVGGETYVATSVSRGHSLNQATSNWAKLRVATTRDKQLAVHTRGQVSTAPLDHIATGVSKAKFQRFKAFDVNLGVSPSKQQTADRILNAANLYIPGMSNSDKVLLARLAVKSPETADAIYRLAHYENNHQQHNPRTLSTPLLQLAQTNPRVALEFASKLDQACLTRVQANQLAQLSLQHPDTARTVYTALEQQHRLNPNGKDIGPQLLTLALVNPAEAHRLGEFLLKPGVLKATADGIMQNYNARMGQLAVIGQFDPAVATALKNTHFAHAPELQQLSQLAQTINNNTAIRPQADNILTLARSCPGMAGQLAALAMSGAPGANAAISDILQLQIAGNVPNSTLNRLAHVASANPQVGTALVGLCQASLAGNMNFDAGIVDHLAMHLRQSGGIPPHGTNPSPADCNRAVMNGFKALLIAEYGATIGNAVFTTHVQPDYLAGNVLSPAMMQAAVQAARIDQDNAIQRLDGTAPLQLPEARRQAALKAFAQAERAGLFPDAERAQLYKAELLTVLENLSQSVFNIDGTANGSLLTKIAGQVGKKEFDDKILLGIRQHIQDTGQMQGSQQSFSYLEAASDLVDRGALAFRVRYSTLDTILGTTRDNVSASLNSAFTNLCRDLNDVVNPVGARFFGDRNLTNGIQDLTITSSDPHKRGERVLIFDFGQHLGQDQKLVYKPRDVRIDAMMTGDQNGRPEGDSLADIVNATLGPNSVPTYKFLPGPNNHETDYGYVEFVSNQSIADNRMTRTEAAQFYREFGRQMAMFTLLGTRDLHHTNMYVSGHRPVFTDLEITLHPEILQKLQARQDPGGVVVDTQATMALTSHGERIRQPNCTVAQDRMNLQSNQSSEIVLENYVWVYENPPNGPLVDFDNVEGKGPGLKVANQIFASEIELGFSEVIDALAGQGATLNQFADNIDGMHVRVHPIATGDQLGPLQSVQLDHLGDNDDGAAFYDQAVTGALAMQNRAARMNAAPNSDNLVADRVKQLVISDFANGDVAYFTRQIGHQELLHDGTTPVPVNLATGSNQFYPDDGLTPVRNIFANVANDQVFRDYMKSVGQALRRIAENGGGTDLSNKYQQHLH